MESTQIILIVVILVLTTILSIIGVEVFLILKEVRESIRKMNKILGDAGVISESVAKPISGISDLATGLRGLAEFVKKFLNEEKENKGEEKEEKPKEQLASNSANSAVRRFFLRAGKKLA